MSENPERESTEANDREAQWQAAELLNVSDREVAEALAERAKAAGFYVADAFGPQCMFDTTPAQVDDDGKVISFTSKQECFNEPGWHLDGDDYCNTHGINIMTAMLAAMAQRDADAAAKAAQSKS